MSKGKKLIAVLACLSLVVFALAGCGGNGDSGGKENGEKSQKESSGGGDKEFINMATATTAGIYYALGNGIADMWNEKVDGLQASVQSTAGSAQNVKLLSRGEAQVAFMQNGIAGDAWSGKNVFEGEPTKEFVGMTFLYPNLCYFVVRENSGINSLEDLAGKRLIPGPVGSGTELNARQILDVVGINYKEGDAQAEYVSNAEAATKFVDGKADMAFIAGGIPHSSVTQMMSRRESKILEVKGDLVDKIQQKYPAYFPISVPPESYPNQDKEVKTVAVGNLLVVRKDVSEDLVYEMLEKIYANTDTLASSFKAAKDFKTENGLNGMTLPLHPGAVKFFEDNGVKVPDKLKL